MAFVTEHAVERYIARLDPSVEYWQARERVAELFARSRVLKHQTDERKVHVVTDALGREVRLGVLVVDGHVPTVLTVWIPRAPPGYHDARRRDTYEAVPAPEDLDKH